MAGARGRARTALAVVVLLTLVAGCTSGGGDAATPTTATPPVDRTVRLGLSGALVLDPAAASPASPSDQLVLDLLYDGLTRIDGTGQVQPALADTWRHNGSFTSWRFHLDPAATFASGRRITAGDVIASIERVAALGDTSLVALALEPVSGFRAFAAGSADHLAGLTAIGTTEVRFKLEEPLSVFPVVVATPALGVVDVESLDESDGASAAELDLSGGWSVSSADGGDLSLEPRGGVRLDGVELHAYPDADAAYDAFTAGEVDWASVPVDRYTEAVDDYGDGHFAPFHAELFFGLHLGGDTLRSAPLRQAIDAAIDREAIVATVYPGLADPLSTVVPMGVPGYDDARCGGCGFDAQRASALVAEAFPAGDVPTVNVDYDESPAQEAMAKMIAADLATAGIPTKLRPLPLEDYKRFVVSGAQELFTFGWIGVYTSPDAYLAPLFVSDSDDNLTAYRSDAVDGYLGRARADDDAATNAERWAKAERLVMDSAVVVPIAQFRTQVVVADRVQGWEHAVDGTVDWGAVTIGE